MNNRIARSDYIKALQIINCRMEKDAGIKDILRNSLGYLQSGATNAFNYGKRMLDNFHRNWHGLKDNPKTKKRLNALKAFNKGWELLGDPEVKRIEAGIGTIDGIDRTVHAIDADEALKSIAKTIANATKDIIRTGDVKKYLKKGLDKAHEAVISRYPSIKDTEDSANILLNGPEKQSSYNINRGVTKALLKQAMYKKADKKDFTTSGLDPDDPDFTRLFSTGQPVYGPLTPKEQLAQDTLDKDINNYNEDIKGVQRLESDLNSAYTKHHTPHKYYDTMGEAFNAAKNLDFDMSKYLHPNGPFGIGNTVFGEGARTIVDTDRYYNTDAFSDGYYGPLRKVLNDIGYGITYHALGQPLPYIPGIGRFAKIYNPLKMGEMTIPLAIMNHLGEDLGQARGALINEEAFNKDRDETAKYRNNAYARKQDALNNRNKVFSDEENWNSQDINDIMYRAAANSAYDDVNKLRDSDTGIPFPQLNPYLNRIGNAATKAYVYDILSNSSKR